MADVAAAAPQAVPADGPEHSILQDTALRAAKLAGVLPPLIVCGEEHRFLVAEQLREFSITPSSILLEPVARNTAPALAVAALAVDHDHPDTTMLVLPADHLIRDEATFARAVASATAAATPGALATFGIISRGPETGYGYIEQGEMTSQAGCFRVRRFVEKSRI